MISYASFKGAFILSILFYVTFNPAGSIVSCVVSRNVTHLFFILFKPAKNTFI